MRPICYASRRIYCHWKQPSWQIVLNVSLWVWATSSIVSNYSYSMRCEQPSNLPYMTWLDWRFRICIPGTSPNTRGPIECIFEGKLENGSHHAELYVNTTESRWSRYVGEETMSVLVNCESQHLVRLLYKNTYVRLWLAKIQYIGWISW